MATEPLPTRQRLLAAALGLFAERGFAATTVGDIEAAAGLVPRRGALYRHFASKEALLRAVVAGYGDEVAAFGDVVDDLTLDDLPGTLVLLVDGTFAILDRQRELLRILQRDGDRIPDVTADVHTMLVGRGYETAVRFFRRALAHAGRDPAEAAGIAAIALGSIVHHVEDIAVYGVPPAGAPAAAFKRSWILLLATLLDRAPADLTGGAGAPPTPPPPTKTRGRSPGRRRS
jgi:AcrR family transcriptional regulator